MCSDSVTVIVIAVVAAVVVVLLVAALIFFFWLRPYQARRARAFAPSPLRQMTDSNLALAGVRKSY